MRCAACIRRSQSDEPRWSQLSKLYHPDMSKDPKAKEKFQAVSDAYAVLGDDRKRRAYDKSLASVPPPRYAPGMSSMDSDGPYYNPHPRRGATHAWEYSRRPGAGRHYTPPHPQHTHHHTAQPGRDPFTNPHVQRATGRKAPRLTTQGPSEADRVHHESGFWRVTQVVGIVLLVATIGGGFSANAN